MVNNNITIVFSKPFSFHIAAVYTEACIQSQLSALLLTKLCGGSIKNLCSLWLHKYTVNNTRTLYILLPYTLVYCYGGQVSSHGFKSVCLLVLLIWWEHIKDKLHICHKSAHNFMLFNYTFVTKTCTDVW